MRIGATEETLVKVNLTLNPREIDDFDTHRELAEASSDSEVIRQAIRYLEQYLIDDVNGRPLLIEDDKGHLVRVEMRDLLGDPEMEQVGAIRRNLIIHKRSVARVENIQNLLEIKLQKLGLASTVRVSTSLVVRCALRLHKRLCEAANEGRTIWVQDGGERIQVRI